MGGDVSHHASDLSGHPDAAEMRARYARVEAGRGEVTVDGLVILAGLYCAISPWVVHFSGARPDLLVNNLIMGLAVAVIGLGMSSMPQRMRGLSLAAAGVGVWMIVSPWVVTRFPDHGMIWNNVVIGAVICLLGLGAALAARRGKQHKAASH